MVSVMNLTEEQKKRQRIRSWAIAAVLLGMVALFYVVTIVRLGSNVASRAF